MVRTQVRSNRKQNAKSAIVHKVDVSPKSKRKCTLNGRPKGVKNKITRELKEAIVTAAELVGANQKGRDGLVGYLSWMAMKHPALFARLLEKLLPLQIASQNNQPLVVQHQHLSPEQVKEEIAQRGLPMPPSLLN